MKQMHNKVQQTDKKLEDIEINFEEARLELLAQNKWLILMQKISIEQRTAIINFGPTRYIAKELVNVILFPKTKDQDTQTYRIYGTGNKVVLIYWQDWGTGIEVEIDVSKNKCNIDLPRDVIHKLVLKGTCYYFKVRNYFNVDTYQGLKGAIEIEKERLSKTIKQ